MPRINTPDQFDSAAAAAAAAPAAEVVAPPVATHLKGVVRLAVSPWGQVEVNGKPAGATPPLTQLVLPEGPHTIIVRNAELEPLTVSIDVRADRPVTVRHRFGS